MEVRNIFIFSEFLKTALYKAEFKLHQDLEHSKWRLTLPWFHCNAGSNPVCVFSHEYWGVFPDPSLDVAFSIFIKKAFLENPLLFYIRFLEIFRFSFCFENNMVI